MNPVPNQVRPDLWPGDSPAGTARSVTAVGSARGLLDIYALLAMTLLFSAGTAGAAVVLNLPAPGILLTLAGYFGFLFAVHRFKEAGWALSGFRFQPLGWPCPRWSPCCRQV